MNSKSCQKVIMSACSLSASAPVQHSDDASQDLLTILQQGNLAMRNGDYVRAMRRYLQYRNCRPELTHTVRGNISLVRKKYLQHRQRQNTTRVAVCGWSLGHNAAGRAHTLATIYQRFTPVEMIGCLMPDYGTRLWGPIRNTDIPIHELPVNDNECFVGQAEQFVVRHPYDVVHLSKPRMPNIIIGLLYKLIWGAKIIMDIDDEELAFVKADSPIALNTYLEKHNELPPLYQLANKFWTQIAVGLAQSFDGVTVCNQALQEKYGGTIIRHARDERKFKPSIELTRKSRKQYGIDPDDKVVLFFGTPRRHKGLMETAYAIAILRRTDVLFCIVGDFPEPAFKEQLEKISGVRYLFLPNQSVEKTPAILSVANCCVFLQNVDSLAAQYQTPAKLSDALAMGVQVIASGTSSLQHELDSKVVIKANPDQLAEQIVQVLDDTKASSGREFFEKKQSLSANAEKLEQVMSKVNNIKKAKELELLRCEILDTRLYE